MRVRGAGSAQWVAVRVAVRVAARVAVRVAEWVGRLMPAETHSHHGRELDRRDVLELVIDQLADLLGRDIDDIRPELRLRADLDADDLTLLDLVEALEQELGERMVGVRLSDDELVEIVTVTDLVDCICEHLGVGPVP